MNNNDKLMNNNDKLMNNNDKLMNNNDNNNNDNNDDVNNNDVNNNNNIQKKRGRKKKIPIIEEKKDIVEDISSDNLKIEQVKKKRGRKKKWEVETTTKLISNNPISFSQNLEQSEDKPINDNYDSQNILFGNLNIKIHSNKDQTLVEDIKQTLINTNNNNNNNNNNKKNNNNENNNNYFNNKNNTNINNKCNINLSNSDYEDSDNEEPKYNRKIEEKNLKIMKFFENKCENGKEIITSYFRCYNCHHKFNNKPFFLPIKYDEKLKRYKVTGNFCSPNCVKSYALKLNFHPEKLALIGQMYRQLFGKSYVIKPAPPIQCLNEYGGNLTIEEYRNNFINDTEYTLKNIISKVIVDEIIKT
jgi:hypothetical protein